MVGYSGLIVNSIGLDSVTVVSGLSDLPLNDVLFSDRQHGWIAGGYLQDQNFHSILLKTNDAGQTWDEINFNKYLIHDMYFFNSLDGYAVGKDTANQGVILNTLDGGDTWRPVCSNLNGPLNALHFVGDIGWAVGDNGLILRADGTTWINQTTGKIYPLEFKLSQNYPNPFNPNTTITYQVSNISNIELSIYNILGQKVTTLVSKKQPAGAYKIEWDASDLPSGLYLYRLEAEGFVEIKKMILSRKYPMVICTKLTMT